MAFESRQYVIIPTTHVHEIDFSQVLETSAHTCRYSVDGTQTFVKYDGDMPSSVAEILHKSEAHDHEQFMQILNSPDWTWSMNK
jgi:hypothetical protein